MRPFATLLHRLVFTPQRNAKLRLIAEYFRTTPDPDRGYGLAALTGTLDLAHAKPAMIRALINERADPALFALSYDFVGDLAETVALMWPAAPSAAHAPSLSEVVVAVGAANRAEIGELIAGWLDNLDAAGRHALLKLITGGLRVGVSARLAKTALAQYGNAPVAEIEEVWHGLQPPYLPLFAWLEGRGARPEIGARDAFRPMMLAHPIELADFTKLDPDAYVAEWKWDGIRVQIVAGNGDRRLFSRAGDDIGAAFPDLVAHLDFDAVLDGELLIVRDGEVAPFNDLQQRLGRKTVTAAMRGRYPAHVRVYDILFDGPNDLRAQPFLARRQRLQAWLGSTRPAGIDLSPLIAFASWDELAAIRGQARADGIEGLMLKRKDSPYLAGRPKGPWFKWKRDPLTADCVLMYAQRGHGKRSSYYSDYTFGCWRRADDGAEQLLPVGKAYFGFTDDELRQLDRWVRTHTVERFGPVRAVSPHLVLEIAFDAVQSSTRHKSGIAMRFPRVQRIRWDKPAIEADHIETLCSLTDS